MSKNKFNLRLPTQTGDGESDGGECVLTDSL